MLVVGCVFVVRCKLRVVWLVANCLLLWVVCCVLVSRALMSVAYWCVLVVGCLYGIVCCDLCVDRCKMLVVLW